jgi:hypothetical protein
MTMWSEAKDLEIEDALLLFYAGQRNGSRTVILISHCFQQNDRAPRMRFRKSSMDICYKANVIEFSERLRAARSKRAIASPPRQWRHS